MTQLRADLAAEAARLGFAAFGVAPASENARTALRLEEWLAEGMQGSMEWMAERAHHRRSPQGLWPEAQRVIGLGMSYAPATDPTALAAHAEAHGRDQSGQRAAEHHGVPAARALARARFDRRQAAHQGLLWRGASSSSGGSSFPLASISPTR